jgi:hypothetical protein
MQVNHSSYQSYTLVYLIDFNNILVITNKYQRFFVFLLVNKRLDVHLV